MTRPWALLVLLCALALLVSGCATLRRGPPQPGRTRLDAPMVILPAVTIGNYLVVESKWDRHGPYRFLIDTGASVTLVTPELAARYRAEKTEPGTLPLVRVKSAEGETALLTSTFLRRIELGGARFEQVQALVYDCASISAHLGVKIDGILGFPMFRETLLTLDYPNSRVVLTRRNSTSLIPGTAVAFNNDRKIPIIPIQLGGQSFVALIDSGSDALLSLNPVGIETAYATPPRAGSVVSTLTGDRPQRLGRLAQPLTIGNHTVHDSIIDLTDELSALGGGLLKHFVVTFDQAHNRVVFFRNSHEPLRPPAHRSTGLAFSKTPAYWRIASIIARSPAATAGVQTGDLVVHINGEPVEQWGLNRYAALVRSAGEVTFTFVDGARKYDRTLPVFELVP